MNTDDTKLTNECVRLAREVETTVDWIEKNQALVGRDLENHKKNLRKAGRFFKSCSVAAERQMCAGVFGPSQAGKSYLVSTLAGNIDRKLWTQLGNKEYDFLSEINPAGGKESTGLVTRFTLNKTPLPSPEHPVYLRLLSYTDVVKILANTYYSDAEHMETPDREEMLASLDVLEKRVGTALSGGITEDDVEDLQEYIHKYFRSKPRVQQLLNQPFWNRVIPLAPRLNDEDRADLFGIIWNGIVPFTNLLKELGNSMRSIGFAKEVFCPINALTPRDTSIIDVATLGLLAPKADDSLEVYTQEGKTVHLPRVYVTALTAELVIPMKDKPADFFAHTDLLDFPGYRSRKMFVDLAKEAQDPAKLKECFLRGKVAYLFERYCAERELTSLLLCIGSGVQEVQGLGGAVNDWIMGTHGEKPEARTGKDTSLFFVLTKSDLEFEDKAGAKDVSERWDTRMYASMEIFASHEWLKHWDTQGAFTNFFLMRNPTVKLHLFDHDSEGQETGLKQDMLPYVQKFADAFEKSPLVNTHFTYKRETWKSFLTPGDGGLSLIRQQLAPICKPELKRGQITSTVNEQLARLHGWLTPYWKTDDKEEERRQKDALAITLAKIVLSLGRYNKLGVFLRNFMLKDQEVFDLYFQTQHQFQERLAHAGKGEEAGAGPIPLADVEDDLALLFGDAVLEETKSLGNDTAKAEAVTPPKDEAQAFCEEIEKYWIAKLRLLEEDLTFQNYFAFPASTFSELVHELSVAFVRLGVRADLEAAIRAHSSFVDGDKERRVWKIASVAAVTINNFVSWLGLTPSVCSAEARTIALGANARTVFNCPEDFDILPKLQPTASREYLNCMHLDWAAALSKLVKDNVNFDGVRDFDVEANGQLRKILDALALPA